MTLNQLFCKLTNEKFTLHEVNFGGAAKISTSYLLKISFVNNAKYHYHPMNPDADVTHQPVNFFSSDKSFICFIFDVPHYIR